MKRIVIVCLALALASTAGALAQGVGHGKAGLHGPGGPHGIAGPAGPHGGGLGGLERNLFPPELILRHQIAIGLTEEQLTAIHEAMDDAHGGVMKIHSSMARVVERLEGILEEPNVDEAAALAAAEEVMALEMKVKARHLSVMIRIKNVLTESQQQQLRELRPGAAR